MPDQAAQRKVLTHGRTVRQAGLERLAQLLVQLRSIDVLDEREPGFFRLKSRAFLHFHYGDKSINADVRLADDRWTKFEVWTRSGQRALLDAIQRRIEHTDQN